MADKGQTIIIKKIKKGGHGHHGGAWKVAYADFVTAMMAFFLLLWLLQSTPVEQLAGLADYFSPTIGLQGKMGIGFAGGKAPSTEGWSTGDWASLGLIFGAPPSGPIVKLPDDEDNKAEENEPIQFESVQKQVAEAVSQSAELSKFKDSILIEQTPEGVNIQISDQNDRPMFEDGTDVLMSHTKVILSKIANIVGHIPNYIQIIGHTNSTFVPDDKDYTGWELSTDRANSARRYLEAAGIQEGQVVNVIGRSNNDPINVERRDDPANSRISIILLRKAMLAYNKQPAPEDIILGPLHEGMNEFVQMKHKKAAEKKKPEHGGEEAAPTKEGEVAIDPEDNVQISEKDKAINEKKAKDKKRKEKDKEKKRKKESGH
jgi:chemotaxis protein MotB